MMSLPVLAAALSVVVVLPHTAHCVTVRRTFTDNRAPSSEDWQKYLTCLSKKRYCWLESPDGECDPAVQRCRDMAERRCKCGCLGYPGASLDHDLWEMCVEKCSDGRTTECSVSDCRANSKSNVETYFSGVGSWACKNICTMQCRCECLHSGRMNRTSAANNIGIGPVTISLRGG